MSSELDLPGQERYVFKIWKKKNWFLKPKPFDFGVFRGFRYVQTGKYSYHWEGEVGADEIAEYRRLCRKCRYSFRFYPVESKRSNSYRREFFKANSPERGYYRCRYCHKKIAACEVTVDHLIPVQKAQASARIRKKLGGKSVNDVSNLVPACQSCNAKKGNKLGLWYIRGKLGAYRSYWVIRTVILLLLLSLLAATVIHFLF